MKVIIYCHKDNIELQLLDGKKMTDKMSFPDARDTSQKLLASIDKLIARNKLRKSDIKNISVEGEMEKVYSARRIAEITAKTFNFAIK